jgi:hypothetical protein
LEIWAAVILKVAKLNWELDCTPKAITEHVRIIKNRAKGGGTSTPAAPAKVKKSTSASGKKSTPKSKPRPAVNGSPSGEEGVLPTPMAAKLGKRRGGFFMAIYPPPDGIKAESYGYEDSYKSAGAKRVKVEEVDAC